MCISLSLSLSLSPSLFLPLSPSLSLSLSLSPDVPQQGNGYDCGMFACAFANLAGLDVKASEYKTHFTQQRMPNMRKQMVVQLHEVALEYNNKKEEGGKEGKE